MIGFNAWTGIGLQDHGYRFPEDFGFIDLHATRTHLRNYSAVRPRRHDFAASALDFMDQLYRRGERGIPESPRELHIPPVWMEGESLRPYVGR